jgi:hypothetical protein
LLRVKPPDIDAGNETFHSMVNTTRHTVVHEGDGIDGQADERGGVGGGERGGVQIPVYNEARSNKPSD